MVPASPETAQQTRAKLLDAAGELFAEKGYEAVTIREICTRANANVASVNYHFKDKQSLYFEVVKTIINFAHQAAASSTKGTPKQQLTEFISQYLRGLLGAGRPAWVTRLMMREMADPTPALKHIVETVIAPTETRLRGIIAAVINDSPDKLEVRLCAHSIIGQCLHYKHATPVMTHLWPTLWDDPKCLDTLVAHITAFSLGGLKQMKSSGGSK